nr:transcriptional regulator [Deltaproteobacteria bacterium]
QRALAELSPRDRNLLRLELIDRLTLDAIAQIHQVHPVTVSRWRAALRKQLHQGTRRVFEQTLRVDRDEFHSIMRLIGSQLDVSLPRLLRDE